MMIVPLTKHNVKSRPKILCNRKVYSGYRKRQSILLLALYVISQHPVCYYEMYRALVLYCVTALVSFMIDAYILQLGRIFSALHTWKDLDVLQYSDIDTDILIIR